MSAMGMQRYSRGRTASGTTPYKCYDSTDHALGPASQPVGQIRGKHLEVTGWTKARDGCICRTTLEAELHR